MHLIESKESFYVKRSTLQIESIFGFVNKRQVEEYEAITGGGWYYKMYQIMVSTASNAMKRGYPITAQEIAYICRDLDNNTGMWYGSRDLNKEADRAIEYIFRSNI